MDWKNYTEERKLKFCNLHLTRGIALTEMGMPILEPYDGEMPESLIPFHKAIKSAEYDKCVHFYLDDYQFERIWNTPEKYIHILKRFHSVIAPDFSVFLDVPMAVNLWNIYRSRIIAKYLQEQGINVIPNISVVPEGLEEYALGGLYRSGIVAISNVQASGVGFVKNRFEFTRKMIERISPRRLLVYGNKLTISTHKDVTYFNNENINNLRLCTRR